MAAGETKTLAEGAPPGPRWLLLGLTLLLVALAVFEVVYLAPRSLSVAQNFAGHMVPGPLRLLGAAPEWAAPAAGLAVGAFAVWQRGSLHRLALLATAVLAVNLGLLLAIVNGLFQALPR